MIPPTSIGQQQGQPLIPVATDSTASISALNQLGIAGVAGLLPQHISSAIPPNISGQLISFPAGATVTTLPNVAPMSLQSGLQPSLPTKSILKAPPASSSVIENGGISVVSTAQSSASDGFGGPPPVRLSEVELSTLAPAARRRYDRNLREQQRSYRISQQIKQLRDVLASSNIPFKPNKFSILVSVAEYIKELQSRAIMLDSDHKRLVDTIRQTNELVASGQALGSEDQVGTAGATTLSAAVNSPDTLLIQGIDFETIFHHCPYPLGVASLDGRVLACNKAFENILGIPEQGPMLQQSLFLFIRNHQEIFEAMADLLKRSSEVNEEGDGAEPQDDLALLYWCGKVVSSHQREVCMM